MTQEIIKIGNPPDYRMTVGKQLYHHQASIRIKLNNGSTYTQSLSSVSMFELVRILKEKLLVIGSTTQIEMASPESGDFTGRFFTTVGEAKITYKRNAMLSDPQTQKLNDDFARNFD